MIQIVFLKNFKFYFYLKLIFYIFLYHFDMLKLIIILKKYYFNIFYNKKYTLNHNLYQNLRYYFNIFSNKKYTLNHNTYQIYPPDIHSSSRNKVIV
jgi:hypothetical protein